MADITNLTTQSSEIPNSSEAVRILSDRNLHQCLWLPQTSSHEPLRVTFSTTSNFSDTNLPTLLFCGPMFSSRWMVLDLNRPAIEKGVRVIFTDRPGMGGSTRVPLNLRVQVWLETVPILLEKLNVKHVGLACHSTGVIFALNTMYRLRDVLDPRTPYLACMAPWTSNRQPHTTLMQVASKIPNSLFDYWHGVIKFTQQRIVPTASWSGGIFTSMTERPSSESISLGSKYGTSEDVGKEIERLKVLYLFQEDISGADEDARLCLRKEGPGTWGVCEDYADFVRSLVTLEQQRATVQPNKPRIKVHAYFASSDVMIGKAGQKYFEECWRQDGVEEFMDFESWTVEDTSHDSIIGDPEKGAVDRVFRSFTDLSSVEGRAVTDLE